MADFLAACDTRFELSTIFKTEEELKAIKEKIFAPPKSEDGLVVP